MEIIFKNKCSVSLQKEDGKTQAFCKQLPVYGEDGLGTKERIENPNFEQELIDFGASSELIEQIKTILSTQ